MTLEYNVVGKSADACDGRRSQTANSNHSGHITVTTGGQSCESVTTGFRDNKENRKQINWEPMKRESMWGVSLKEKKNQTTRLETRKKEKWDRNITSCEDARMRSALCKASLLVFLGTSEISALGHHQNNTGRSSIPSAKEKVEMLGSSGITFYTILLMRLFWVNLDYEC